MTGDRSARGGSSISHPRRSRPSSRSERASSTSGSLGDGSHPPSLGAATIRELAARHGIRPTKSLGQHFLIDPNLARAIVADADVRAGDLVVEIGAGFGSLTVALAAAGAEVLAVEVDRGVTEALEEVVAGMPSIRVLHADAMKLDWPHVLTVSSGPRRWTLCANLPYNIAVPLVLDTLAGVPAVDRWVVMVQREVGERLSASPGHEHFGAASLRVAYRASVSVVRRVPATVFWPRPGVDSVIVRLDRLDQPPVEVDEQQLFRVIDTAFAERRKTLRNALRRLGLGVAAADEVLAGAGVAPNTRPEEIDLRTFASIAERMPA